MIKRADRYRSQVHFVKMGSDYLPTGLVGDLASEHASSIAISSLGRLGRGQGSGSGEQAQSGTALNTLQLE